MIFKSLLLKGLLHGNHMGVLQAGTVPTELSFIVVLNWFYTQYELLRRPVRSSIAASILFKAESISLAAVKYWDWSNSASLLYTDVECPNTLV